jgi:hypothetical protein
MMSFDNKEEDDGPIMISLETAEKILIIRDYIADKKGIKMGFQETINHMIDELVEKESILDELHKYKKKNNK